MIQWFAEIINLPYRNQWAFENIVDGLKVLFTGGSARGIVATCLFISEMFGMLLVGNPVSPWGQELDLTGYELIYEDEFEGDTLNLDDWYIRYPGKRKGGFNSASQISLESGNLILTGEYNEDGTYGAGWYGTSIALKEHFLRGYFEIRCKCAASDAFWSAFWLQGIKSPYNAETSKGGIESCEIDIFEAMGYNTNQHNAVTQTIHCAGVDGETEGYQSRILGFFKGNDIYNEYNTYGVEWTDEEYIFYINGVETTRSSFGDGVCINPEEVIISLCVPSAENFEGRNKDEKCEMIVDYVRIYQYA